MARKANEKNDNINEMDIPLNDIEQKPVIEPIDILMAQKAEREIDIAPFNPLKNETVIVRYIPNNSFPDPRHPFHGGVSEKAVFEFCVPSLENGTLKNPLSNAEKAFFEEILGLEKNALSIYKKGKENFWSTANPNGIGTVKLNKQDAMFNLSDPTDWLKVRILEMHSSVVAKSYKEIQENTANDYKFVIVHDANEAEQKKNRQYYIKESWKILGKIEDDKYAMRYVIEKLESRPVSPSTKIEVLSTKCGDLIEDNAVKFYSIVTDEYFDTKVLIMRAISAGLLNRRNGYYYTKDGQPLCEGNQNSTEEMAAQYLNMPKNQDLLFMLQEKVNE